jgi:transposase
LAWATWCWKAVQQFVCERFGLLLGRTCCTTWLHRLGFVQKRPLKRLVKADAEKREAFVAEYATLREQAEADGAKVFFVDEAHFRADVEVRQMWVPKGAAALIDSTSPRLGEKATYYSAICLETGEIEAMPVEQTCTAATTVAFLKQLRAQHCEPLIVIWDNGPMHRGQEIREYLATPDLRLRLVALPAYSPDFNADEPVWDWIREEATANTCFGTARAVRQRVDAFLASLAHRTDEVMRRCRTRLQARADRLVAQRQPNAVPIAVSL